MRNLKLARPASSVVVTWRGLGTRASVTMTCVFGGKFSIEQVKVTLGPVEGTLVGLQVSVGAC
jgi:hypothetical protein